MYGTHRDLPVRTHLSPTRRSADFAIEMLERACTLLEPMHRAIQAVDHADPITGQILGGSGAAKHATDGAIEIAQPARPQRSFDIAKENDAIVCAAIFGKIGRAHV